MTVSYDLDIIAWANEQAAFIRAGRFDLLDIEHIADEIEDVGKSERHEFENRMAILLAHLLKCQYQPERRGRSWECTIKDQRYMIARRLQKTPSLKPDLDDVDFWRSVWADGKRFAENETGILNTFPVSCPWTVEQVLGDWFPDAVSM